MTGDAPLRFADLYFALATPVGQTRWLCISNEDIVQAQDHHDPHRQGDLWMKSSLSPVNATSLTVFSCLLCGFYFTAHEVSVSELRIQRRCPSTCFQMHFLAGCAQGQVRNRPTKIVQTLMLWFRNSKYCLFFAFQSRACMRRTEAIRRQVGEVALRVRFQADQPEQ